MHTSEPPRPRIVWALWVFLTAATIGFVVLIGGIFGDLYGATLAGAGLMAFATMLYLFVHFWSTAHASFAATQRGLGLPTPEPIPGRPRAVHASGPARRVQTPSDANAFNFDHLVTHTLERTTTEGTPAVPQWERRAVMEQAVMAGSSTTTVVERRPPATERRSEWIGGLPIIKEVLGDTGRPTDAAKPGRTKGQCSNCRTILWAPAQRPIRLRCPKCSKVAWLEK